MLAHLQGIKANPLTKTSKAKNDQGKHRAKSPEKRKAGSPLDHLPADIEVLTYLGKQADFSPDNLLIAFGKKGFHQIDSYKSNNFEV